ncbi:MAG: hypothetical protein MJZ68_09045 [archaeon]|nr:hypothetical protein [archaeon]
MAVVIIVTICAATTVFPLNDNGSKDNGPVVDMSGALSASDIESLKEQAKADPTKT